MLSSEVLHVAAFTSLTHSSLLSRGEHSGVYELRGEKISLVFLIVKELTGRMAAEMERKGHEQVTEEFGEGICINVSARVLELMKCKIPCLCALRMYVCYKYVCGHLPDLYLCTHATDCYVRM